MLDRAFRRPAAGPHTGFLFEQFRIAAGPDHFIDRRWHEIIGEIMRMRPGNALSGLGFFRVMREILRKTAERFAASADFDNHSDTLAISRRISLSRGSRSDGNGSPV